jgi:hypothetical protein
MHEQRLLMTYGGGEKMTAASAQYWNFFEARRGYCPERCFADFINRLVTEWGSLMSDTDGLRACYTLLHKQLSKIDRELDEIFQHHKDGPLGGATDHGGDKEIAAAQYLSCQVADEVLAKIESIRALIADKK